MQLIPTAGALAQGETGPNELAGFRLISATEGRLRLGQHLYWTEITHTNLGQSNLQAGWLALTQPEAAGGLVYSLWNRNQRVRQYTGGHNETWGGLTLNIDSDVSEGVVASLRREKVYLPLILLESEAPPSTE